MVLADSHGISRAPCYLGYHSRQATHVDYGATTRSGRPFKTVRLYAPVPPRPAAAVSEWSHNPERATPAGYHTRSGLASSAFARHYSRNHCCFLFLWVLRCFTSPRSLYPPYIFRRESPGQHAAWRGFPIRKSSDHSPLIGSPRLIADCYVLLRLQMPRHPPFALKDLKSHEPQNPRKDPAFASLRCSRPLCSSQSTGGTPPSPTRRPAQTRPTKTSHQRCLSPQDPTTCTRPTRNQHPVPTTPRRT